MDVTTIALAVDSTQVNSASAALDKMAASGGRAEASAGRLAAATAGHGRALSGLVAPAQKAALSFKTIEEAQAALGKKANLSGAIAELGATQAKADSTAAALRRMGDEAQQAAGKAQSSLAAAGKGAGIVPVAAGSAGTAAVATGLQTVQRNSLIAASALGKTTAANNELGKSAKFAAFQQQQLGFQIHDFAVQVISGQNPLTAFVQQGSQLSGTFGGAGNALRAVAGLFTPLRIAMLGAGAAVGVLATAFIKGQAESKAFADAIVMSGNFAGQTEGQFNALAKSLSASGQVSISSAREIGQALISTGEIGPQVFAKAQEAGARFAAASGKTAAEVAQAFTKISQDPAKAAVELNRSLNFLSAAQIQSIQAFQENGRAADAQGVIYDALNARLRNLEPNLGTLDRLLRAGSNTWHTFWDAAFDIGRTETIDDKLAAVNRRLQAGSFTPGRSDGKSFTPGPRNGFATLQRDSDLDLRNGLLREQGTALGAARAAAENADIQKRAAAARQAGDADLARAKTVGALNKALGELKVRFADAERGSVGFTEAEKKAQIDEVKARFAPAKGTQSNEAQQLARAELEEQLQTLQANLNAERDAIAHHGQELQAIYRLGNTSLADYYSQRDQEIKRGVAAELAELQKEREAIEAKIADPRLAKPTDQARLQKDLSAVADRESKVQRDAAHALTLSNIEQQGSFKALADQVENYRASLLQVQGDELGAARLRNQQAVEQARILAVQASGPASAGNFARLDRGQIGTVNPDDLARGLETQARFADIQQRISVVTQSAQIKEESFLITAERSGKTLIETESEVYAQRSKTVEQLSVINTELQAVAASSADPRLKLFAAQFALDLKKAADAVDPALNRLRDAVRNTADNIADDIGQALTRFTSFKDLLDNIGRDILAFTTKLLVTDPLKVQIQGVLTGITEGDNPVARFLKDTLGIKGAAAAKPPGLDTSAVSQSLASLQAVGIDPTTTALQALTAAANGAAGSVGQPSIAQADGSVLGATGDFARADRLPSGEQSIADLFKPAEDLFVAPTKAAEKAAGASDGLSKATVATTLEIARLAASSGQAGGALSILPAVIQTIQAASAASSASGGGSGGGFFSAIASFFSGGSGGGFGSGSSFGNQDLGQFFHTGGIVGQTRDMRPVDPSVFNGARKYHTGGIVDGSVLPSLKANEVPAILLGGPKGVREEVLHAGDPRHRDNIAPTLLKTIETAQGQQSILSVLATGGKGGDEAGSHIDRLVKHDKETHEVSALTRYLMGSPATVASLIEQLSKESDFEGVTALREIKTVAGARELGGPVSSNSLYRVNERGPELLQVAGKQYLMTGGQGGDVVAPERPQAAVPPIVVNNHFAPGTDHAVINQAALQTGRAVQRAMRRNG